MANIAYELPTDFDKAIARNAGVILTNFDTSTWAVAASDIIGATTGGLNFTDVPEYTDWGEDIDNCPKNTKELKQITSREVKLSGTFVSANQDLVKKLIGAGTSASKAITPSDILADTDFTDLYFVCDYGTDNAVCITLKNCLNTSGFAIQTTDKAKGQFAFEFTAHYSIDDIDAVPYTVTFKA